MNTQTHSIQAQLLHARIQAQREKINRTKHRRTRWSHHPDLAAETDEAFKEALERVSTSSGS